MTKVGYRSTPPIFLAGSQLCNDFVRSVVMTSNWAQLLKLNVSSFTRRENFKLMTCKNSAIFAEKK